LPEQDLVALVLSGQSQVWQSPAGRLALLSPASLAVSGLPALPALEDLEPQPEPPAERLVLLSPLQDHRFHSVQREREDLARRRNLQLEALVRRRPVPASGRRLRGRPQQRSLVAPLAQRSLRLRVDLVQRAAPRWTRRQ
jgi:hypothetical protein